MTTPDTTVTDELLRLREAERHETARQRRYSYIKMALITGAVVAYASLSAMALLGGFKSAPSVPYASVVKVSGEIMPDKSASAKTLSPLLEQAFQDKNSRGVILLINSPGGAPVQSSLIHDQVLELKAKYKKPVYAVGEDLMASGAYMIAVSADKIVVNRSTITGSIGVISRAFGFTGLMEKLGVERRVATAGSSKNLLDPFSPATKADTEKQRELLEAIHAHFISTVIEGRRAKIDAADTNLFSGAVWTGDVAVEKGLADELGSLRTVLKDLEAETFVEVTAPKNLLDTALSLVTAKVLEEASFKTEIPLLLPR